MRSHEWKIFATLAWFCKYLATRGNQTRARPRYRSKNEAFVIYHERKHISPIQTKIVNRSSQECLKRSVPEGKARRVVYNVNVHEKIRHGGNGKFAGTKRGNRQQAENREKSPAAEERENNSVLSFGHIASLVVNYKNSNLV